MHETDERFWQLIEESREPLWRFALGLTRSRDDACDLVSDAVLAAHKSFSKLKDLVTFRKFLFTIALRLHKRRVWRRRIFGRESEAANVASISSSESSHDLELLIEALGALPAAQRESLLLFEFSGLSIAEIREVQGGSLSGVKSRLKRGRESLARQLCEPEMRVMNPRKELASKLNWKMQELV